MSVWLCVCKFLLLFNEPGMYKLFIHLLCSSTMDYKENCRMKQLANMSDKTGVIYSITCECGTSHVGETGRKVSTRVKEHRMCLQKRVETIMTDIWYLLVFSKVISNLFSLRF